MTLEPEPLSDELRALIEAERNRAGMPDAVKARLAAKLGLPPIPGGDGGCGGGTTRPDPAPAHPRPASTHAPPASPAAVPRAASLLSRPLLLASTTFALGLAGGALIHSVYDRSVAEPPRVERVVVRETVEVPAPVVAPAPVAPVPVEIAAPPPVRPRHAARDEERRPDAGVRHDAEADVARRDTDLAAERALLEMARTALGRGQGGAAIEALEKQARQFPRGRLVEEREVLLVQALAQAGRTKEARERGDRFRQRFPHSLLLPAVDAVLKSAP